MKFPFDVHLCIVICYASWTNLIFCLKDGEPQWKIVQYQRLDDLFDRSLEVVLTERDYSYTKVVCSRLKKDNAFAVLTSGRNHFQSVIQGEYTYSEDPNTPSYLEKYNFYRFNLMTPSYDDFLELDLYPCFLADSNKIYLLSAAYEYQYDRFFFVFATDSNQEKLVLEALVSEVSKDVNDFNNKYFIYKQPTVVMYPNLMNQSH